MRPSSRWRAQVGLSVLLAACGTAAGRASNKAVRSAVSEGVKVDQVGYLPARPKLAMVTDARATGAFSVRRTRDGAEIAGGTLGPALADPDTGDTVRLADFSALTESGSFYLDVAGLGTSDDFEVAPDVYARAFLLVSRAFYGQRCGMAVDLAPLHPGYSHPACHVAGTRNPDALFHAPAGATRAVDGSGGWHDAGDYGKYVVNSGISTGELLWAYEAF